MKFIAAIYILFLQMILNSGFCQTNLVPNYSFEQYNICPNSSLSSPILNAIGWKDGNINGTADYYNTCVTNFVFGIPVNSVGSQYSKTGNAYGGIRVYAGPNYNGQLEYLSIKLSDSLKANHYYCVQYLVSRADTIGDYGISNFGALFTDSVVNSNDPYNIQMTPQVKNPTGRIILDKKNWTAVSGTYTAIGGEHFITIGNFDSKQLIDTLYDPNPYQPCGINCLIYYYIDDVTVEEVADVKAGRDTTINCGSSITLGADSAIGAYYKWVPSTGLNNDSIAFPIANPTVTTTYIVKKTQCHIITYDTITVTVNNNCTNGIEELNNKERIVVYPNPTINELNVSMFVDKKDEVIINLYNMMGALIKTQRLENNFSNIDVSMLYSGIYLYEIEKNHSPVKKNKFVIAK